MVSPTAFTPTGFNPDRFSHAYIVSDNTSDFLTLAAVCSGLSSDKPCMSCVSCGKVSRRVHPDVTYVGKLPDKREIVVEQIRDLQKDVVVIPTESNRKVYVVSDADLMNRSAQNAFLRILEEPPSYAVFILCTDSPAALLPTVRSRCIELKTQKEYDDAESIGAQMADELFDALKSGNMALGELMFRLEKLDKDEFPEFLNCARGLVASYKRDGEAGLSYDVFARALRLFDRAEEMLDLNVGIGHVAGYICAALLCTGER